MGYNADMFGLFQKKVRIDDLAQTLALSMHDRLGDSEDLAREAFSRLDMPLDGYGFDAAMEQVRFAQAAGRELALENTVTGRSKKEKVRKALREACQEVGYLKETESSLYGPHVALYERSLHQLASGDPEKDYAVLGRRFCEFLVADHQDELVQLGTRLFREAYEEVARATYRRRVA